MTELTATPNARKFDVLPPPALPAARRRAKRPRRPAPRHADPRLQGDPLPDLVELYEADERDNFRRAMELLKANPRLTCRELMEQAAMAALSATLVSDTEFYQAIGVVAQYMGVTRAWFEVHPEEVDW